MQRISWHFTHAAAMRKRNYWNAQCGAEYGHPYYVTEAKIFGWKVVTDR